VIVLVNTVVFLVPAYFSLRVIRAVEPSLSYDKVVNQILIGGAYILPVIFVELVLDSIITYVFFGKPGVSGNSLFAEDIKGKAMKIVGSEPLGKLESYAFVYAFLVPAAIEEGSKWRMAEMAIRRETCSYSETVCITMLGALGFAAGEHYLYSINILASSQDILSNIIVSLFRGALCFPLHVGTSRVIGLGLAEVKVLGERNRFWIYFALAVFTHGLFDALPFLEAILAPRKVLPEWILEGGFVYIQMAISTILVVGGRALLQNHTDILLSSSTYGSFLGN